MLRRMRKQKRRKQRRFRRFNQKRNSQRLPAKDDAKVLIHTSEGDITVLLYGDTPRHRDNFLKLVEENFYDSTLFHRVINEFMVQAGDPDSKTAKPGQQLGSGDPGYTRRILLSAPLPQTRCPVGCTYRRPG